MPPPQAPGAQRPQAPGVQRPQAPGAQRPQAPGVQRPQAPGVQRPQAPAAAHAHPSAPAHHGAPHAPGARGTAHHGGEAPPAKGLVKLLGHGDPQLATKRLYIYGGAAAGVLLVLAIVFMSLGGKEPARLAQESNEKAAAAADQAAKETQAKRLKTAEAELKRCEAEEAANPRAYLYLESQYKTLVLMSTGLPEEFQKRVKDKLDKIIKVHVSEGAKMIEFVDEQVAECAKDKERGYCEALRTLEKLPPEIEGLAEYIERFRALKKQVVEYAKDERHLVELEREAKEYARKKLYDVAERVIREGFNERDFSTDTPIWKRREETLRAYEGAFLREENDRIAAEESARKAKEREAREKDFAQRFQEFTTGKDKITPEPLLGPYDLINWPFRSRDMPWQLEAEDGSGRLTAKVPDDGRNWVLGPHGNYWEDYSLTFKVKVAKGALVFFPRLESRQLNSAAEIDVSAEEKRIRFDAENMGSDWVTVTVDVVGSGDASKIWVEVAGGKKAGKEEYAGERLEFAKIADAELSDRGAFLFVFGKGSEISLKDVNLRLVRHSRRGILD